ncbi:putative receptor protein-tyrosine kinase RLK-Pelle-LRR-XI-1 family [Helianthus annuus]|nr:putative receptor protein-tyrosine kinase RLK-Pelle-LRR-XI-1 family [Helianthus annuus]KAJ0596351.1 putative receptor protein-tyrosine kinase RLK-Pelle-LRR-XI-1 family [Helianthus annuus]
MNHNHHSSTTITQTSNTTNHLYNEEQLPPSQLTTMTNLRELLQTKWNSSSQDLPNPCSWTGVLCNQNNSVITGLSLSSFSLFTIQDASSWSSLVCGIETLETLDVSNNQLAVIAPPLLLSSCGGGGLKVLNFSFNMLSGNIPSFQSSLEGLDLSHNSLHGVIPDQITELVNLSVLDLSYNQLNGPIPSGIDQLSKLQQLLLSENNLSGSIPSGIGQLLNLWQLILSVNNLTGEIPPSIAQITTLKRFSANYNGFTGSIPLGITRYLSNLDLSYNKLTGSVPSDLLSQPNLQTVDLSFNNLKGTLPVNVSKSLFRLRLGSNRLTGVIPLWSFGNDDPSLAYLEVGNNSLTGMIPPELRLCKNLSLLDLSHNNLTGYVPRELGDLNKLQVVQLDHNSLSGEIPDEISELQILNKLNMSWNSLNGSIPPSLSKLQKLMNLDLQANYLTGQIPDSFGNMNSLLELQLGKNRLSGVIRSLPPNLQISLNLSRNNFEGPIPASLSRSQSLEILDLSNNRFNGSIPNFLTQMGSLTQILLSNNLLTGSVPRFSGKVNVSTEGNINLSYPPPTPSVDRKNNNAASVGIVVASAVAVVTFIILVVAAVIVSRKFHRVNDDETPHSPQLEVIKSKLLTLNVIHRTNIDFTKAMECVGQLSSLVLKTKFSTYYKAVMPSGMSYFVKKVDPSAKIFQLGRHDLIEQELETLGRLRNSNVMIPLAYALTVDSAYLLYEFTDKGTLFDVLHGSLKKCLDWTNRYSIALGVANGLAFLHGCPSGPILLLDLSSKGVMLKSLDEPQIGDIELSKVIDPSKSTGNLSDVAGSVGYVPPEYAYTMRVTMPGNVYSFGVILLELLTGKTAVSEGSELAKWVSAKSKEKHNVDQILDSTICWTSRVVKDQMLAVLKVALACVNVSPEARPDMRNVIRMLLNTRN